MIGRYDSDSKLSFGRQLGTNYAVARIRNAIKNGTLPIIKSVVLTGGDRLDTISGDVYGDGRLWWILAAASDIGWAPQVPPGTIINIVDISKAFEVAGI